MNNHLKMWPLTVGHKDTYNQDECTSVLGLIRCKLWYSPNFGLFLFITSSSLLLSSVWRCFSQSEDVAESFFMEPCPYSRLWASAFCWARFRFLSLALDQDEEKVRIQTQLKGSQSHQLTENSCSNIHISKLQAAAWLLLSLHCGTKRKNNQKPITVRQTEQNWSWTSGPLQSRERGNSC